MNKYIFLTVKTCHDGIVVLVDQQQIGVYISKVFLSKYNPHSSKILVEDFLVRQSLHFTRTKHLAYIITKAHNSKY